MSGSAPAEPHREQLARAAGAGSAGAGAAEDPADILDSPEAAQAVVRGGIWRMSSYFGGNLLAVVMAAVIVRYLGVRGLARYTTVVSLTTLVSGVFEGGLGSLGVREAAVLRGAAREEMLRSLLGLRFAVAVAGIAVAAVIALIVGYPSVMVAGVVVAGVGILVFTLQTHYSTPLQVQLRLASFSALELARQAILTLVAVLFVVLNLHLVALLAAPIPTNLIVLAMTLWLVRRAMPFGATFGLRRWRGMLGSSFAVAVATASSVIYTQVAVVLMSLVSTQVQTGLFSASFRIYGVLAAIPGTLVASVLPILSRAAKDSHERLHGGLRRTWEVAALIGSGLAALTIVGAPVAIEVVAGPRFQRSIDVLHVHGASLLPVALIAFAGYALLSLGAYKTILVCNLIGVAVTSALTATLGASDGAIGAAIANLAGDTTLAVLYVAIVVRRGYSLRWRPAALAVLNAAVASAVALLLPVPDVVRLVIAAVIFTAGALALGLVPEELITPLRGLRERLRIWPPSSDGSARP